MIGRDYRIYEMTVGDATSTPRQVWGINCIVECDCPTCEAGEHRVDAFNRGTHKGWYDTLEEAQAALEPLKNY